MVMMRSPVCRPLTTVISLPLTAPMSTLWRRATSPALEFEDDEHAIFPVFRLYDCGKWHQQRRRSTCAVCIRELQGADHPHLQQVIVIRYCDFDLEVTCNRVRRR